MHIAELLHPLAARVTLGLFVLIWGSAVTAGLFADRELLAFIKEVVVWSLFPLVPIAMITAITGLQLTRVRPSQISERKRRRLRLIAAISIVVLLPATLWLDAQAQQDSVDGTLFFIVQGIELAAGLVTLVLMGISVRDGILAKREAASAGR
ncbi:hypothetical protein [Magnetospirillum molischianum]|uniref:Transmembrane protein n=1 Tax=Magnetospirillum molischianum DSM 120 TaxID=1150626 RepID=H8FUG3_MAGML|nr:hypothetical protein [Magnetospirillum molischianum]CCG42001.1 membrane hypothetical protein [Magnetospirillum molischianum DSM 120]